MRLSKRQRILLFILAPLTYIGVYIVLTANGSWALSQTGNVRYGFGLAASDVQHWSPVGVRWERFRTITGETSSRANVLGYLFSPLIRLDRAWLHPDREVFAGSSSAN